MKKTLLSGVAIAFSLTVLMALPAAQATLPLVQQADLVYQGAFRYPQGAPTDAESFSYGGSALTYYAPHNSLFAVGFDPVQRTAELSIPAITNTTNLNALAVAGFLQPLSDAFHGRRLAVDGDTGNGVKTGAMLPLGNELIISAFTYYDGGGTQSLSHFRVSADLSQTGVVGPVGVTSYWGTRAGFVFSFLVPIPSEWQAAFGGPAFTGGCCKAIIGRTSLGPSLTVFNPASVGVVSPVPGTTVLGYDITHATIGAYDPPGYLYNGVTEIGGAIFPPGTRSVLFFGRIATAASNFCYGAGTLDPTLHRKPNPNAGPNEIWCYDPTELSKGTHGFPYTSFVWAYDANDLLTVKSGAKKPWEIVPYASWAFTTPFQSDLGYNGTRKVPGATYDPATQRVFLSMGNQDGCCTPLVHVFKMALGAPPPPPQSLSVSVSGSGTVVSVPAGINCTTGTCSANFAGGSTVGLSATPASGWALSAWSGACTGTGTCSVTMDSAKSATATFAQGSQTAINVALASNGATALATSIYGSGWGTSGAINGDRRGVPWENGGGWNDGTQDAYPDWLEVDFSGTKTITEIDVFSVQDNPYAPIAPTATLAFSTYGLRDFDVQTWTGTAWATVPGGAITNNALVWRQVSFAPITTTKIRVLVTRADAFSRIAELEAWTSTGAPPPPPPPPPAAIVAAATGQCSVAVTATPPDTSGGWSGQIMKGSTPLGSPMTSAPYTQTVSIPLGAASITVAWAKAAVSLTSLATAVVCQ